MNKGQEDSPNKVCEKKKRYYCIQDSVEEIMI